MPVTPSIRDCFSRIIIGAALFAFAVTAAQSQPTNPADPQRFDKPIVVGAATDSYPGSYIGPNKLCQGFCYDVLEATARVMSLKLVRVTAPSGELAELFREGKLDMLQSYSPGPGREVYADFSTTYMVLQGSFIVRKNETRYHTPAELGGAEVAIPGHNSIGEKYLRDNGIFANLVHTRSVEESLRELNAGKHDAAFAARLTALSLIEHLKLRNIQPLGQPLVGYEVRICFAVHKGDMSLLARLNEGLAIINRTGEYDDIYQRWYGRFDKRRFSQEEVFTYTATILGIALVVAMLALLRQRALRKRVVRQAQQIVESEALLAEAQRIAHLGYWRYDADQHTLTCSAETLHIIERDPSSKPPSYFRLLMMMPPAERALVHRSLRATLQNGIAADITCTLSVRPHYSKVVQTTARPLRDDTGRISGLFGTVQDITRQKATEEGMRAREQLLRALYDNVPIALGVVEPTSSSFRFVSANAGTALLLGLGNSPLANRVLSELSLPSNVVKFWADWFSQGLGKNELFKTESYQETTRRNYSITLIPLGSDKPGERSQLCFLVEDITERKEIDAEVAQGRRLRAIGELVGGIAHEFNNLLTPIMLKAEILAIEWSADARLYEDVQIISRAAKRGADLTRRLLTFGRRSDTRLEEVNLHPVIQANFDLLRPTIDRRISFEMDVSESLPTLCLNSSSLHQIVINLLLNARDTLAEKLERDSTNSWTAKILVEAKKFEAGTAEVAGLHGDQPRSWLRLTVRDNGMGMTREVQERIFEPFYTTKEVGKGTGLGLATVWHLVHQLKGKVTVESEPGTGSAFHLWLPVVATRPQPSGTTPPIEIRPPKAAATILLVEDDELVGRTVSTTLKHKGHQVTHFVNGNDAWEHLRTHLDYDLLLLDLDLPGISGLEITRRARAAKYAGRILIASGRLSAAEVQELDQLHVDAKLQKPFTAQTLHTTIQHCLFGPAPK